MDIAPGGWNVGPVQAAGTMWWGWAGVGMGGGGRGDNGHEMMPHHPRKDSQRNGAQGTARLATTTGGVGRKLHVCVPHAHSPLAPGRVHYSGLGSNVCDAPDGGQGSRGHSSVATRHNLLPQHVTALANERPKHGRAQRTDTCLQRSGCARG
jgi:hypothetical protein